MPAIGARRDAYEMRKSVTLSDNQEAAKSLKSLIRKSKVQITTCINVVYSIV